jgi:hypothetical protein
MECVDGRCIEHAARLLKNETAQALSYVCVQLATLGGQQEPVTRTQLEGVREEVRGELHRILGVIDDLEKVRPEARIEGCHDSAVVRLRRTAPR